MKKISVFIIIFILFSTFISACNLSATKTEKTKESNMSHTAVALTLQANMKGITPAPTLPTLMEPGQQGGIQSTSAPAAQNPEPEFTTAPVSGNAPCDRALFVDDISIPDNTKMDPGSTFTKTWRLQNDGSCTWTTEYALVFTSGDELDGPTSVNLPKNVPPGQGIDISVSLKAPSASDTYRSNWMLRNASGEPFGLGDYDDPIWVIIKVEGKPTPSFSVTNASFDMIPGSYTGVCPFPVTLRGKITTSAAGKVTYYYQREDGFRSDTMEITFDSSGQKTLPDYSMPIGTVPGYAWSGKVWLYIDNPNHQNFGEQVFSVNCLAP